MVSPAPATVADSTGGGAAPKGSRLGCLFTWWGMAVLFFLPLLVIRLLIEVGGLAAWFAGILQNAHEAMSGGGMVPGGEGGLVLLAGIAIFVVIIGIQSLIHLLTGAVLAPIVAVMQAVLVGVGLRGLLDLFSLRTKVPHTDPRYLRKWRARGALAAAASFLWVVVAVPALSRLGPNPAPFPEAAIAVSVFVWSCVVLMPLFSAIGLVVRAVKRRR